MAGRHTAANSPRAMLELLVRQRKALVLVTTSEFCPQRTDAPDMAPGGPKKVEAADCTSGGDHRRRRRVEHEGLDRVRDSVVTGTPRIEGRVRANTRDVPNSFVDQRTD
ncbi:hypothetical protein GCM10010178_04040 [Lentzea flava]|uniref:Uncharacterized protein n=1 Tax=Lentzea flava TaxID=103732 RepID=A0ABQ2U9X8_9PSEU|nr:hypothetical protein GCM10010178_04040 [Lentzea flava]